MKHTARLAVIAALISGPVAAQPLSILLPTLTFPEPVTTPSTKDCAPRPAALCAPDR